MKPLLFGAAIIAIGFLCYLQGQHYGYQQAITKTLGDLYYRGSA